MKNSSSMQKMLFSFKLLADIQRLRIVMLLDKKELSVCQLMGIIGASQPLISRNLSLLYKGGFLDERKEGKLKFYGIKKEQTSEVRAVLSLLRDTLKYDRTLKEDRLTLRECIKFQKEAGKCDMKTLIEFMHRSTRSMK